MKASFPGPIVLLLAFVCVSAAPLHALRLQVIQTWTNPAFPADPFFRVADRLYCVNSQGTISPVPRPARPGRQIQLPAALSAPPLVDGGGVLFFLQDGSTVFFDSRLSALSVLSRGSSPVMAAVLGLEGRLYTVDRDGILGVRSGSGSRVSVLGYAGTPAIEGLSVRTNRLEVRGIDGILRRFTLSTDGVGLASPVILTNIPGPRVPVETEYSNIRFSFNDGCLVSEDTQGRRVTEISGLPPDLIYRISVFPPFLALSSVSGPSFLLSLGSNIPGKAPSFESPVSRSVSNSRGGIFRLTLSADRLVIQTADALVSVPDPGFTLDQVTEIVSADLDGDGGKDLVVASIDNITLAYFRLTLLLDRGTAPALIQRFTTIDYRSFDSVFTDLDGDRRREMVLNKEMLINFSKRLDRRLLVPDVYSLTSEGYRWDSISFPAFFSAEIPDARKDAERSPFNDTSWNTLWQRLNAEVVRLETQLVTLNRQMRDLRSRERDERNRQGLSLWFYKQGVEFYVNRWDNLALFAFRKSLELNPGSSLALYQATRIYCDHGIFDRALSVLRRPGPSSVRYLESQDYYAMTEENLPVVNDPGPLYKALNLATIGFENGLYAEAADRFAEVLAINGPESDERIRAKASKRLAECRFALNQFDQCRKALNAGGVASMDPELVYWRGVMEKLTGEMRLPAGR